MTGRGRPPKAERNQAIIAAYKRGDTLHMIGAAFGISMQCVHAIIRREAPEIIRSQGYRFRTPPRDAA